MDSTEFIWGTIDTGFINRRQIARPAAASEEHEKIVAVVAALIAHEEGRQAVHIGQQATDNLKENNLWKQAGRLRALGRFL
jgi:acetyl-CoA carboxylase, biotin carboxylase subunit